MAAVRRLEQAVAIAEAARASEVDSFDRVLAAHLGADAAEFDWKSAIYRKAEEELKAGRGLTVEHIVELAPASRATFYCFDADAAPGADSGMDLRDAIEQVSRGYAKLRPLTDYSRVPPPTKPCSDQVGRIYPNLARDMAFTDLDQFWITDIRFVRLHGAVVLLAVIADAFSRQMVEPGLVHQGLSLPNAAKRRNAPDTVN